MKDALKAQLQQLDPVLLLREIRAAQQALSDIIAHGPNAAAAQAQEVSDVKAFLAGLATAWRDGEVRPTHRKRPTAERTWRTRADPFADAWPVVEGWLIAQPTVTAKEMMDRLAAMVPDVYASKAHLRTLQRRVKAWRATKAKDLILGSLRHATVLAPMDG